MTETVSHHTTDELLAALCRELIAIAQREEEAAANEAARTPYWSACPPSVQGHRQAARALRENAERLETRARG